MMAEAFAILRLAVPVRQGVMRSCARSAGIRRRRLNPHNLGFILCIMFLSSRFKAALVFATRAHAGQQRKGTGIPYVSHLLAVAALVLEHGGGEDEAIAALLHDAPEDQGSEAMLARIRAAFGVPVAAIVTGCCDTLVVPKPPWRARKERYIAALPARSPEIRLVSCADKLHSARATLADYRAIGEELWARFNSAEDCLGAAASPRSQ